MKNRLVGFLVLAILGVSLPFSTLQAQPSDEYLAATLDILVGETMQAYNSEDYVKFFEYFSKEMSPITTKQYFKAIYVNGHKLNLGDIYVRELNKSESSLDPDFPMLVYDCEFQKYADVKMIVNFTREYGNYRIKRIRIDKIYPEQGMGR